MKFRVMIVLTAMLFLVSAVACESSYKKEARAKLEKAAEDVKADEKAKKEEAKKKAEGKKAGASDAICFGDMTPVKKAEAIDANGKKFERFGAKLVDKNTDEDKAMTFGVLTDIKSAIPATLQAIDAYFDFFKQNKVEAVLVTGDSGEEYKDLKTVFEHIGKKGLPTYIIMGNREKSADFDKALEEAGKTYKNLFNMNRIRFVNGDDVDLVSLPGYHDPEYIHNKPGCQYDQKQLDLVATLAKEADSPLLLIAHGPPRGKGKDAIDNAVVAGNIGDPNLAKLITDAKIKFGSFGNVHEAGGKAVGADFSTIVKPDTFVDTLYLHPGPGDSDPWTMNDGSKSKGMAGVLMFKDGKAAYKVFKNK